MFTDISEENNKIWQTAYDLRYMPMLMTGSPKVTCLEDFGKNTRSLRLKIRE
jgi:hypothetical protein